MNAPVPKEFGKCAIGFGIVTQKAKGIIFGMYVPRSASMPFDNDQQIIDSLHDLDENTGLIEVASGKTGQGKSYAYNIRKHTLDDNGEEPGARYFLNFNIELKDGIYFLNGDFTEEGMTGLRESIVYAALRSKNMIDSDLKGWSKDPYDPEYKHGYLMNL